MKSLLFFAAALFCSQAIFAHALWIETSSTGQKGKAHEVRVYYGEYSEGKPDKVADWYSDMKEFSLWLVTADNQRIQLPVNAAEDHFTARFTPEKEGLYYLQISHEAKDLGRTTKYQFNTSAAVRVGKNVPEVLSANHNPLKFSMNGNKVKQPVAVRGFFNNAPSGQMTVTVVSPKGWTKEIKGNSEGLAEFVPEWAGRYMIEISRTDEEKGDHHGKSFDHVWRCATYFLDVKE